MEDGAHPTAGYRWNGALPYSVPYLQLPASWCWYYPIFGFRFWCLHVKIWPGTDQWTRMKFGSGREWSSWYIFGNLIDLVGRYLGVTSCLPQNNKNGVRVTLSTQSHWLPPPSFITNINIPQVSWVDNQLVEEKMNMLVDGLEHFYFSIQLGIIITPTDFHSMIFQRGRYTTNQNSLVVIDISSTNHS